MGMRVAGPVLMPVLYFQGRQVQRSLPRIPEPPGERTGLREARISAVGSRPPLRLLVVGDSAAAGVGAPSQDLALLGQLVHTLATERDVAWKLIARTGATAIGTRRHLAKISAEAFDVAVTSLGTNDVMSGRAPDAVLADLVEVASILRKRFGVRHVLVTGMPPVDRFPALPQPLRWYIGRRARMLDDGIRDWAATTSDVEHLPLIHDADPIAFMAFDGFHPGPELYEAWARLAAARVVARDDRSPG